MDQQTRPDKLRNKELMEIDAEEIYSAHMQCEGRDFLVAMIAEGIMRLNNLEGEDTSRLIIRGLQEDLRC